MSVRAVAVAFPVGSEGCVRPGMEEEPEIPRWCARMPGDPEIDRDVKSGEEKLWEAVYDNKTEKMELLFKMLDECVYVCQQPPLSAPNQPLLPAISSRDPIRVRGVFVAPQPGRPWARPRLALHAQSGRVHATARQAQRVDALPRRLRVR